ncbi:hypothetical protein OS493_013424 [Desmophyllum pertusum]|uniref:Cadherin domain-containing protein n=1 Tax=Desmophyllum pertusum TaxID=174260 RepID=A0A9W9YDK7_9CNID|nr:hypothetical protein OS493_013424 [Desmophyllum pertusum]
MTIVFLSMSRYCQVYLVIKNSPDFELKKQYDLTIEAADKGKPDKSATAPVKVIIEDVNDHKPTFNQSDYSLVVSEGTAVRSRVGSVYATDSDSGPRGRLVYTIKGGNVGNAFAIDGNTGVISVYSSLDRETDGHYTLTVEARDGGNPSKDALVDVNITISDVNDNKPLFDKPRYSAPINEDASTGASVVTVFAKDDDMGKNKEITYDIKTGNEQGMFILDENSGLITLNQTLDHETKSSYALVVTASDHGTPPLSSSVDVMVIVNDVNDNPPKFPKSLYNCTVAENLAKGVAVCYVTADDPDSGVNGQLFYTITSGDTGNAFEINAATGEITTKRALDRESISVYNLRVKAEDGKFTRAGKSFSATTSVAVYIMDENDNGPIFNQSSYTYHVLENATMLHVVGGVTATDKDAGPNGEVTYSISAGNSGDSFKIDPSTGVIRVKSTLDRETQAQFSLTVIAKDSGTPSLSASTVVMVMIDDVNDNAPVFSPQIFYGSIREDASPGSTVLKVEAKDKDEGTNGQLQFDLQGKGRYNFSIDSRGFIHTATPLDYEKTGSYILTATAMDGGSPPGTASAQVNITIINVDDNVPVFETSSQASKIREDVAVGTRVVRLNATDADGNELMLIY